MGLCRTIAAFIFEESFERRLQMVSEFFQRAHFVMYELLLVRFTYFPRKTAETVVRSAECLSVLSGYRGCSQKYSITFWKSLTRIYNFDIVLSLINRAVFGMATIRVYEIRNVNKLSNSNFTQNPTVGKKSFKISSHCRDL